MLKTSILNLIQQELDFLEKDIKAHVDHLTEDDLTYASGFKAGLKQIQGILSRIPEDEGVRISFEARKMRKALESQKNSTVIQL